MSLIEKIQGDFQNLEGEVLKDYINLVTKTDKKYVHKYYYESVEHKDVMSVHFEGRKPIEILKKNRPNEPDEVKKYRLDVWESITESFAGEVLNTTGKIFSPKHYSVDYPNREEYNISEDADFQTYLTEDFGIYLNFWNYVRETLLKKDSADPNAVVVIIPQNPEVTLEDNESNDFLKPIPIIYGADNVVDFEDGVYYTLWEPDNKKETELKNRSGKLIIADPERIRKFYVKAGEYQLLMELTYDWGEPPVFRLGAEVEGKKNPYWFKSFFKSVAPFWNKAIQRISDMDASIIGHLYMESYEFEEECSHCNGSGKVTKTVKDSITGNNVEREYNCSHCEGSGFTTNKGPFGTIRLRKDSLSPEIAPIIPPKDYITKPTDIIDKQKELIEEDIYAGFKSINLESKFNTGENQSGVAKEIDRQDKNAFFMRIGNHFFDYLIPQHFKFIAYWMYWDTLDDRTNDFLEDISISKPKEFNDFSIDNLMEELKTASQTNVSTSYLRQIEKEIVNTRFANNDFERKRNLAEINLKPFPNRSVNDLLAAKAARAITEKDFIRNENISDLVSIAIEEDETFLDLSQIEQLEKINTIIEQRFIQEPLLNIPVDGGEGNSEEDT